MLSAAAVVVVLHQGTYQRGWAPLPLMIQRSFVKPCRHSFGNVPSCEAWIDLEDLERKIGVNQHVLVCPVPRVSYNLHAGNQYNGGYVR